MLYALPAPLRGVIALIALVLNTLFWCWFLFAAALLKVLLPLAAVQRRLRDGMHAVAEAWIAGNSAWMDAVSRLKWDWQGLPPRDMAHSYLVLCNHQSWVDILALQYSFNRRLPMLKFFLKRELIWVPVIGLCWWALEFPFMRRHSRATLEKHPEKRGEDLATTRAACARFATNPVCVFNFVEGTRFTPAKHAAQRSRYRHLLMPRAGGTAFVLDAMGEQLHAVIDVTLHYPDGRPRFWDLLCGRVRRITLHTVVRPVPPEFIGRRYDTDADYRSAFQHWLNGLWQEKDALLERLAQQASRAGG